MRYVSPLRYPGGKAKFAPYFTRLLRVQEATITRYAEPFAGGAGAALHLLTGGVVDRIHINDINPGVAAFWRCVFQNGEALARKVETATVNLEAWHEARAVYRNPIDVDDLELGFATFFLNRTNRSGILNARPIGGLQQTGRWLIDARYNAPELATRIRRLSALSSKVHVTQLDAFDFLAALEQRRDTLMYVDPPYIQQGEELYMQVFGEAQHQALADRLSTTALPWVLTYDAHERVHTEFYRDMRCAGYKIAHTAQNRGLGNETIVFSPTLVIPDMRILKNREATWLTEPAA